MFSIRTKYVSVALDFDLLRPSLRVEQTNGILSSFFADRMGFLTLVSVEKSRDARH